MFSIEIINIVKLSNLQKESQNYLIRSAFDYHQQILFLLMLININDLTKFILNKKLIIHLKMNQIRFCQVKGHEMKLNKWISEKCINYQSIHSHRQYNQNHLVNQYQILGFINNETQNLIQNSKIFQRIQRKILFNQMIISIQNRSKRQ
ncbi:hypothetical protein pb186bvf_015558 [Paramecium bursaria]